MTHNKPMLAYFGHHKCATTWINSIISLVCYDLNLNTTNLTNPRMFEFNLDIFVQENDVDFLSYTNADIQFVQNLDNFLGFHVIRDPRDIVVSAYFSHLFSHSIEGWPALIEHRKRLQNVSKDEGLFIEMDFRKNQFDTMHNWDYAQPNVLEIKMESIINSPYETMLDAFTYLRLVDETISSKQRFVYLLTSSINRLHKKNKQKFPFSISRTKIPTETLLGYIYYNRFSKMAGDRKKGEEDRRSHYRKGEAGDWKNHFTEKHCNYFKQNFNDLLIKLGYETTIKW